MVAFIDDHRGEYGVEPICAMLPIAPSTFYDFKRKKEDPALRSERAKRDELLCEEIRRVHEASKSVYGVPMVWRQLKREGIEVARCTVERLMGDLGLQGVRRGKRVKTTIGDDSAARPADLVQRDFTADRPNQLWVADFTYVSTWLGFFFVAFVVDVFSRRIVGWRLSRSMTTDFVLDALEQAIHARGPGADLVHHSDQGSQYLSIRYSERLAEAEITPSVGSVADSYDNALAETIIGLYKTELVHHQGPWRGGDALEFATLGWVDWFNHRRLLEPIGWITPVEFEEAYRQNQAQDAEEPVLN